VLPRGRLHAREVRDERRLLRGGVVGLGAQVLEEPLEPAGSVPIIRASSTIW
jgi:hypothetical protein